MFTMVTFIATCIHIFATGYMSDELTENHEDHQVHTSHGHFHRPGRFYLFFAYLSLFSFSMLGLVIAGNIFLVFVFWELVGVCSYFLIGFYLERKSASTGRQQSIHHEPRWRLRIPDWPDDYLDLVRHVSVCRPHRGRQTGSGLFSMVRGTDGQLLVERSAAGTKEVVFKDGENHSLLTANGERRAMPYFLLVAAGIGIFAGCVGKSAQFPLQTWLPDAMEGPTPVSALVHSATMVAAGVYLTGRFYPMFTSEVLLTIAYIGCITLFMAATIAVVATDIKRVLAYSTISQLVYMMLGLGLGGWGAGLFHLITHAFFKSLMFLCSGSVIHGCHHVQEMPRMGGLRRKMPVTADDVGRRYRHCRLGNSRCQDRWRSDCLFGISLERRHRRDRPHLHEAEWAPVAVLAPLGGGWADGVLHVPTLVLHVRRHSPGSGRLRSRPRVAPRDVVPAGPAVVLRGVLCDWRGGGAALQALDPQ